MPTTSPLLLLLACSYWHSGRSPPLYVLKSVAAATAAPSAARCPPPPSAGAPQRRRRQRQRPPTRPRGLRTNGSVAERVSECSVYVKPSAWTRPVMFPATMVPAGSRQPMRGAVVFAPQYGQYGGAAAGIGACPGRTCAARASHDLARVGSVEAPNGHHRQRRGHTHLGQAGHANGRAVLGAWRAAGTRQLQGSGGG